LTDSGGNSRIHARLAALAATPASKDAPATARRATESRTEPREKVYRFARLVLSGDRAVKCVVLDLSRGGARVQFDNFGAGLPEYVVLEFEASGVSRKARVSWERDHVAGLAFLDPSRRVFGNRLTPPARGSIFGMGG
jgi:hypothetical protein